MNYITALYSIEGAYVCDISGNELTIFNQLENIARLSARYKKCEFKRIKLIDRFCLFSVNTKKANELIFTSIIK